MTARVTVFDDKAPEVTYTWPDGFELVGEFMDSPGNRYHIAFFKASPSGAAGSKTFPIDTIDFKGDAEHSLSAIAILDNNVRARDRKLVRDGVSEGP